MRLESVNNTLSSHIRSTGHNFSHLFGSLLPITNWIFIP